jgi:hypothetical protein
VDSKVTGGGAVKLVSGFSNIRHGEIVSLEKLMEIPEQYVEKTVRVVGYLHGYDLLQKTAILKLQEWELSVDTSFMFGKCIEGEVYQIIGEIQSKNPEV